jgi:aconitase A
MEQNKENFKKGEWDHNRKDSYVVNFKGIKYGKCTPTDLDFVLEINNKIMIIAEVKRSERNKPLPIGQRILAENLCRYINEETIKVFFLYVVGEVVDGQIKIQDSTVVSGFSNFTKTWHVIDKPFNEVVNKLLENHANIK